MIDGAQEYATAMLFSQILLAQPDRDLNFDKFVCTKCCKSKSFNLVQRTRRTLHLLVSFNELGA